MNSNTMPSIIKEKAVTTEIHTSEVKSNHLYFFLKRFCDIILSFIGIVLLSPLMIIITLMIKTTSHGSAIYKQKRIGRNGKIFIIYKFRTMVVGAEHLEEHLPEGLIELYKKNRKLENDPRVTNIGKYLRILSLDEVPQIFNIFKGDMSIVGPRPMMPEEKNMYGEKYYKYITVKPGLTGLWQIKSRNRTNMKDRARLDNVYINNMKLLFDISIIFKTIKVVLLRKGAC